MLMTVIMVIVILLLPRGMQLLTDRYAFLHKLGSVFLCYAAGLLLSFVFRAQGADLALASDASSVLVLIAMPLILFSSDLPALRRLARPMLVSYSMNVAAVLLMAFVSFFIFRELVGGADQVSAMLVGTYTGGTPNMFAIGKGLGAPDALLLLTQTADMIAGGLYFFCLLSFMPALLGRFLPPFRGGRGNGIEIAHKLADEYSGKKRPIKPLQKFWARCRMALLAMVCVGAAMGVCLLLPSQYGNEGLAKLSEYTALLMLLVTSMGIALSFVKKVRQAEGSYTSGQYFILMFSVAMGLCFDLSAVSGAKLLLLMLLLVQFGTVLLHLLLVKLLGVDRDTAIITSTAGIFGPAFIIPVAKALDNDAIILPGILCGILGYALGNYLGIGFGWLLALL
ncbi:MAG: DUF819 family protein [Bacillota bacterium]|nr:DUF819 family protein [Bacillota bacterium]